MEAWRKAEIRKGITANTKRRLWYEVEAEVLNREITAYRQQAGDEWNFQVESKMMDRSRERRYRRFLAYCACDMIANKSFEHARTLYDFS